MVIIDENRLFDSRFENLAGTHDPGSDLWCRYILGPDENPVPLPSCEFHHISILVNICPARSSSGSIPSCYHQIWKNDVDIPIVIYIN